MENSLQHKNRSRSVMHLKNFSRVQGGQFSEPGQLSSAILRHSNPQLSFSKAERFPSVTAPSGPPFIALKNTFNTRSTTFGFGQKQLTTLDVEKRDRLNPAPGTYDAFHRKPRAISFGMRLQKITNDRNPGPGEYNLSYVPASPKFSIYPKVKYEIEERNRPDFATYKPKETLILNSRFHKISFGIGNRPENILSSIAPGPGAYELRSAFFKKDKIRKIA